MLLSVDSINVYYGRIHAVRDISFEVAKGEVVTLIGANGAGKTTILQTISGILQPKSGTIKYEGVEIQNKPAYKILQSAGSSSRRAAHLYQSNCAREFRNGCLYPP